MNCPIGFLVATCMLLFLLNMKELVLLLLVVATPPVASMASSSCGRWTGAAPRAALDLSLLLRLPPSSVE